MLRLTERGFMDSKPYWKRYGFEVSTRNLSFKQLIDHRSYVLNLSSWENKAWKKFRLEQFQTHNLCDTGAALLPAELSSQLGAGHLLVRNIPVDVKDIRWICEIHIFELRNNILSKRYEFYIFT